MAVMLLFQLPEITRDANESLRSKYLSLVLDVVGMSLGVLLMTMIAFYEDNIQLLLDKWRHAATCHDVIIPPESIRSFWSRDNIFQFTVVKKLLKTKRMAVILFPVNSDMTVEAPPRRRRANVFDLRERYID